MGRILLSIAWLAALSGVAFGQTGPASEIAPGGKLRVGMIAITVLGGVAEPVARFIGQKLGVAVEPVMYPNPEGYLQSFGRAEWDIAIGPRVLAPADKADSTADLWVISLVYVAAPGKEFPDIASVDKAGVKIGTIRGAPSDRVLTREIKAAELVRIPLSPNIAADAAELLRSGKADLFGATLALGILPRRPCLAPRSCLAPLRWFAWRLRCRKDVQPRRRLHSRQSSRKQSRPAWCRRRSPPRDSRA